MNRWIIALLLAAVLVIAPAGHAVVTDSADPADSAETVDGTDGGTYDGSVTIAFDVDPNESYVLRTATERLPVAQFAGENGTVFLDTGPLDPGEYVLVARGNDAVAYEFTVTGEPDVSETPSDGDERTGETEAIVAGDRYETGTVLTVEVRTDRYYEVVPLFEWAYSMHLTADGGTLEIDTSRLRPGWYAVHTPDGEAVMTTFEVVESAPEPDPDDEADPQPPADALLVDRDARPDAVRAADRGIYYRGQLLRFRVDGDTDYVLRAPNDTELGSFSATDHRVYLNTTTLPEGLYRLERPDGHVVYHAQIRPQTLRASADGTTVRLVSNRQEYAAVLTSESLSEAALLSAFPRAERRDGRVVLPVGSADATFALETAGLDSGEYDLTVTIPDTGARATANGTAPDPVAATATPSGGTPRALAGTATPRETGSGGGTAETTPTAAPAGGATTAASTTPARRTAVDGPGFGPASALAATLAVGAAAARRSLW
ncbi:hypothetical protein [Halobaculum lipolyticum]|uniref:PGF-CTERM protein n=1 Tax=Halobaculum lipolyticum TaxID=3032001 RepID=A0ABD5WF43_9EURY|nr:hypothetical protein [Halobaculum sp. DT31]